jgi:signal transduction histidine kinase/CheY-like chemotaxis protein
MNVPSKTKTTQQVWVRTITKRWLAVFLPLIVLLSGILWLFYHTNVRALHKIIEAGEPQVVELQKQSIARNFKSIVSDVMILSQSEVLKKLLDGYDEAKDELSIEYLTFSERKRSYDQVRYLDETGMEIVRVNFNEGNPGRVPEEKLQSKGKRYYFTDAFVLERGEIFVSPLDLNIERSVIERPAKERVRPGNPTFDSIWRLAKGKKYTKPMIRFATPIYDSQGRKKGIVLVNLFGAQLINLFDKMALNSLGQSFLINRESFWLKGPNPEVEWGFMREHDKEQTCGNTFPEVWERISKEESGQFYTANGLLTFTTIYPLEEGLKTSTGSGEAFEASAKRLKTKDYVWKIVSFVPMEIFISRTRGMLQRFSLLYIVLSVLLASGSWFWARTVIRSKKAEEREKQLITEAAGAEKNRAEELASLNEELEERTKELEQEVVERKQAEEQAKAANQAKSIFLANMSHELRTPLNAVLGFSQLMQQDQETPPSQREDLEIINRSGHHLLALISDVLDMSKIEAGRIVLNPETFDMDELVHDVMYMMHRRAEGRGLQLILDQSSDFPRYVEADPAKLRQILINLLSNAVKYTEEGGITLRLGAHNGHSEHTVLRIEVEDTGIGIAKQDLEHIFQPFEQLGVHAQREGTGLGLALTKQFVEMMGGEIGVESTVGKGSLFCAEIPVRRVDEDKIAQVEPSRGRVVGLEPGQPKYRILIVEDHQDSRLLLKRLLEPVGFAVRVAVNGEEAVHIFEKWKPHFIWMDRRMPVMDGLTATRRIKAMAGGKETVIVVLSASVMKEQRTEVLEAGCDDFLLKPFREAKMFKTMAKHLGLRYLYAEEPTEPAVPEAKIEPGSIADSLAALSPETLSELKKAVEEIDLEATQRIIERISERDRALAAALGGLLKNFRFDILQELTKEAKQ